MPFNKTGGGVLWLEKGSRKREISKKRVSRKFPNKGRRLSEAITHSNKFQLRFSLSPEIHRPSWDRRHVRSMHEISYALKSFIVWIDEHKQGCASITEYQRNFFSSYFIESRMRFTAAKVSFISVFLLLNEPDERPSLFFSVFANAVKVRSNE